MVKRFRVFLFCVIGAVIIAACTVMNDLHLPKGAAVEAGVDAGADDGAIRCNPIRPPPPPPSNPETTGGDDPKNDLFVAVRRFVNSQTSTDVGYDLDGVCTCKPDPESCTPRRGTQQPHCDADGGRDNGMSELFATMASIINIDVLGYTNERILRGELGFILRVQNYNGKLDDAEVTVAAYGSFGPANLIVEDGGVERFGPSFDDGGIDPWSLNRSELVDEGNLIPKITSKAYVSGGVLVIASIDSLEFPLITNTKTKFAGGLITGRVTPAAGTTPPKLDNLELAGRWNTSDLLTALGRTADPRSPGNGLCDDPAFALLAKQYVCPRADVAATPVDDNKGASCDAISVALSFEMVRARFGPVLDQPPLSTVCADAGTVVCDP